MSDQDLAKRVEKRMDDYIHRAKRMTIAHFGTDTAHDHNLMAVHLAAAMANLDAAERYAAAHALLRLEDK